MANLIIFLLTSTIIISVILCATYIINIPTTDYEKHTSYECGFEPFGDARGFFDIHFYVVGILSIIFDLEIVYLIPFVVDVTSVSASEYIGMLTFMSIMLVGFYHEGIVGLLDWLPEKAVINKK